VQLALLMGIDPRTPLQVTAASEPASAIESVEALVEQGMARRPEVRQAEASLDAAQAGLRAARTTNAPTVTGTASFSARGANAPPRTDAFSVGAVVQWTPFDGGVARSRVSEAEAAVRQAEAQLLAARQAVVAEVSQAYLNLKAAEQRVTTAEAEVMNAQESVRLAEGRYNAGVGTFIDVTDAQAALLTARTNHVNAQTAVAQARAALDRAMGAALPSP
jgi:outer membrane protein TolC